VLVLLCGLLLLGGTAALILYCLADDRRDDARPVAQQPAPPRPDDTETAAQKLRHLQPDAQKDAAPPRVLSGPPSVRLKDRMQAQTGGSHTLDKFGNPEGSSGLQLGKDLKGNRVLVWSMEPEALLQVMRINPANPADPTMNPKDSPLWQALEKRGFALTFKSTKFDPEWLKQADQLWIISGQKDNLDEPAYKAIEDFARAGKGLYLLADNEPYLQEANALTRRLFNTTIQGNYGGTKVAYVPRKDLNPETITKFGGNYAVDDHPLLVGVSFIQEGYTISNVAPTQKLETVLKASDGQILAAVAVDPTLRVVVDCGWTRYYLPYLQANAAGSVRFGENVAVYLAGE
jgi:hypothetical protein